MIDLALGGDHGCARVAGASGVAVYCWGANSRFQLGTSSTTSPSDLPLRVDGI